MTGIRFVALFSNMMDTIIALDQNSCLVRVTSFYLGKVTKEG